MVVVFPLKDIVIDIGYEDRTYFPAAQERHFSKGLVRLAVAIPEAHPHAGTTNGTP